jgi:hypothetical protein
MYRLENSADVELALAREQLEGIVDLAHSQGRVTYVIRDSSVLAAIVPVGPMGSVAPKSAIDAAYKGAGLHGRMNEGEARRRLTSALNAAYPHLTDMVDKAYYAGHRDATAKSWKTFDAAVVEPDNPAADSLARHIADHRLSDIQAAMRILGWKVSFDLVEDDSRN